MLRKGHEKFVFRCTTFSDRPAFVISLFLYTEAYFCLQKQIHWEIYVLLATFKMAKLHTMIIYRHRSSC